MNDRTKISSAFYYTSLDPSIVEQHRLLAKRLSRYEVLTDCSFQAFQSGGKVVLER